MLNTKNIDYISRKPFPYMYQDDFLEEEFAKSLQEEILNLYDMCWDRYDNPFEQKYTLRDKYNFPSQLKKLFQMFESDEFIHELSEICGYKLLKDETRNFWGCHKYKTGDKLDIHVDAGLHPTTKQKKQVTLGLYLSSNWKEEYGCQLEIWNGEMPYQISQIYMERLIQLFQNSIVLCYSLAMIMHGMEILNRHCVLKKRNGYL